MENSNTSLRRGWNYVASVSGSAYGADAAGSYINSILTQISDLESRINHHPYRFNKNFQGYVAEEWGAGTFNIDAAAANSCLRASSLGSNQAGSVDVSVFYRNKPVSDYSFKSYTTAEGSAKAQAVFDRNAGRAVYKSQLRWIPSDQLPEAKAVAHRLSLRNRPIRPEVADAYSETEQLLTDTVSYKNVRSRSITRKTLDKIADKTRNGIFEADEFDVTWESTVTPDYIAREAALSGCSAALLTMLFRLAPDVSHIIVKLIREKKIDTQRIKKLGVNGLSASADGFIRGSLACALCILCKKEYFGKAFINADPTVIGAFVSLSMQTVVNTVLLITGKITAKDLAISAAESTVVTCCYLAGAKLGQVIDSAIGWKVPVAKYALGSAAGFSASFLCRKVINRKNDEKELN